MAKGASLHICRQEDDENPAPGEIMPHQILAVNLPVGVRNILDL
jgi:hypothetical protein